MKRGTTNHKATNREGLGLVLAVLFVALSLLVASGCTDGGEASACANCAQGCCLNGTCVAPGNLNDSACGHSGMTCQSCVTQSQTCNTAIGQCVAGTGTVTTPVTCDPACDTFTQVCVGGVCQATTTTNPPIAGACNPACDPSTQVCMGGMCQPIGGNTNNNTTGCVGCNAPNQCHENRCMDPHQHCRQTCTGCCDSKGACLAIGSSGGQSADKCGKGGGQCISCLSARLNCDTERGVCGNTGGGKLRICVHSATIDGAYKDDDCHTPFVNRIYNPEVYVRFQVGSEVIATMAYGAVRAVTDGANWNIGWGGQCVDVEIRDAWKNGIDVVAMDKDSGLCAPDDYIGKCKTNPSGWSIGYGHKFALGGARCVGMLEELWLEVLPQ